MSEANVIHLAMRPHALVVYESMFGNTRGVARAIATGLAGSMDVTSVEVSEAPAAIGEGIDLLVVGGPTHAFGLSRPTTRDSAAQRRAKPLVSIGEGLREWIGDLERPDRSIDAAAFDTKVSHPPLPGSAAHAALRRLRRLGFIEVGPATTFYVAGTEGPLVDGELARAREWGRVVGEVAGARLAGSKVHPGRASRPCASGQEWRSIEM